MVFIGRDLSLTPLSRMESQRENQNLIEMVKCLLQTKYIPTKFWAEDIYSSNFLLNLMLIRAVVDMTPVEKWNGRKPYVGQLITFVCVSWAHISDNCKKKLDAKSHACILMGYYDVSKDYRLFDIVKQHIILSKSVIFYENILRE